MTPKQRWIVIPKWDEFQHYGDRREPIWIKNYTRLLSNEDYLKLTDTQRAVLHGLWLEYARSRRRLPADPPSISRRLGMLVRASTLKVLERRGFIAFSSKRAT